MPKRRLSYQVTTANKKSRLSEEAEQADDEFSDVDERSLDGNDELQVLCEYTSRICNRHYMT